MIEIGKYNTLTILRDTKVGLFLGNPEKDPEGIHEVNPVQRVYELRKERQVITVEITNSKTAQIQMNPIKAA